MQGPCLETLHSWYLYCQLTLVAAESSIAPQHWKTGLNVVLGKKRKRERKRKITIFSDQKSSLVLPKGCGSQWHLKLVHSTDQWALHCAEITNDSKQAHFLRTASKAFPWSSGSPAEVCYSETDQDWLTLICGILWAGTGSQCWRPSQQSEMIWGRDWMVAGNEERKEASLD